MKNASCRGAAPAIAALAIAALACALARPAAARTLTVTAGGTQHGVIQAALARAAHGDTVLVLPGDYLERIQLPSGVTLRSRGGALDTRILGDTRGSVVIAVKADSLTRLEGFTISQGTGTHLPQLRWPAGGGLLCYRSAVRVRDNIFRGNRLETGTGVGGAVALFECSGLIERNEFDTNRGNQGGGFYARDCSLLVVRGNHFVHNRTAGDGGGLFFDMHTAGLVEGNVIERNDGGWGGGMALGPLTRMEVRSNTLVGNHAHQWGAGLFIMDARPLVERNLVAENQCDHRGGGIGGGRAAFPDLRCNLAWHNVPGNYFFREDTLDVPGLTEQIEADPGLCDFTAGNFHPSPGGPADQPKCGLIGALDADCARVPKILH